MLWLHLLNVTQAMYRIKRAKDVLSQEQDEPPTDEQVARVLGIPVDKVTLYTQASRTPTSIEASLRSSAQGSGSPFTEETTVADTLTDTSPTADEELTEVQLTFFPLHLTFLDLIDDHLLTL